MFPAEWNTYQDSIYGKKHRAGEIQNTAAANTRHALIYEPAETISSYCSYDGRRGDGGGGGEGQEHVKYHEIFSSFNIQNSSRGRRGILLNVSHNS
jgi:hypothetical protein